MSSSSNDLGGQQPNSRHAEVVELPNHFATYVDRWAIVIGISKYKHEALNLRYADRDAEEVHKLLLSPIGGNFRPDHVVKLTNHEATTANITRALRSFLKKPGRDDLVIIYCACHGTPDCDRPENVYLVTYDTDPNDVAGTALPMREIDLSLRENLLSGRVVIFADTCHSAAIGGRIGCRSTIDDTALINRYLKEVSATRGGIALLTSAEANEVSFEDARWGGGHGAFTYYLLRGMQGEADINQNGFVTVGELFEYVRAKVQEATEYRQHPSIGTNPYDRNLPLAITFPAAQNLHPPTEPANSLRGNQINLGVDKVVIEEGKRLKLNKLGVAALAVTVGLIGVLVRNCEFIPNPRPRQSESPSLPVTPPATPDSRATPNLPNPPNPPDSRATPNPPDPPVRPDPSVRPDPKSETRLYLHLGKVGGRPVLSKEEVVKLLESENFQGFQVVDVNQGADKFGPGVDYFYESDRSSAERIAAIINTSLPKEATPLKARLQKNSRNHPEGTFGIWF